MELEPFGVTVENQAPFYVATKMSKIRRPRLDAPTPKSWVATGIRQIGCALSLLEHESLSWAAKWLLRSFMPPGWQLLRAGISMTEPCPSSVHARVTDASCAPLYSRCMMPWGGIDLDSGYLMVSRAYQCPWRLPSQAQLAGDALLVPCRHGGLHQLDAGQANQCLRDARAPEVPQPVVQKAGADPEKGNLSVASCGGVLDGESATS